MVPVCSCHSLSPNCHPATVAGSKMEEFWLRRLLLGLALFLLVFSVNLNMTFQFRRLQSFRFSFPQFRQYRLWWAWKLRPKLANFVAVGRVLWQEFTVGVGSRLGCFTTFTGFAIIGSLLSSCARRLSIAEVAGRSCWLLMIVRMPSGSSLFLYWSRLIFDANVLKRVLLHKRFRTSWLEMTLFPLASTFFSTW